MTQVNRSSRQAWLAFTVLCVSAYLALQSVMVLAHEFAHSTTAWLLGYTSTPFTVIWGNPLTMKGWDEGVPYDQLFPIRGNHAEAAIGGMPLFVHAVFVTVSLYFLLRPVTVKRIPVLYALYWFVVANLGELVAYILMRPFIPTGDTGRFNAGLNIPSWYLFLAGTAFLLVAWTIVIMKVVPRLDDAANGNRVKHRVVVWLTAFFMFLWASGLRFISLYPDPLWKWGLIGVVGFFGWVLIDTFRGPALTLQGSETALSNRS